MNGKPRAEQPSTYETPRSTTKLGGMWVIQLAEPRGHAEHGAAGGFALQLASRGVPERCRQPASGSVTWHRSAKRCLRWSFPQGRNKSKDFYICTETR
jgi:hypothetical protein